MQVRDLSRRLWPRLTGLWPRLRRPAALTGLVLVAFSGTWLGMSVVASTRLPIGPVETEARLVPAVAGDAVVALPPLGTLSLDSHDGPLRFDLTVQGINQEDARRIFANPETLDGLEQTITSDLRHAIFVTACRGLVAGALCAGAATLIVSRRLRPALIATGTSTAVILAGYGIAGLSWDPRAVTEPKFDGLLSSAPSLIGTAQDIAENMDAYSNQLVRLVTNVTKLYDVTSTLPAYEPGNDVIRILHVSDMHLGEHAWGVVASVVEQFQVDIIVDSGDITDHGTMAENQFLQRIPYFGVPYVWVRGNHDSMITQKAMKQLANVVVLDGEVETVKGVRFLGAGDPRFTPDRSRKASAQEVAAAVAQAEALAKVAERQTNPVDIVVYHDGTAGAAALDGSAPLILAGHRHVRIRMVLPGGTRLMHEGSTGGSGLRALEGEDEPAPIQMSVLYLGRDTKLLEAWDEITLGGLGLTSAKIERYQVDPEKEKEEVETPTPVPTPTEELDEPLDSPTMTVLPTTPTESPTEPTEPTDSPTEPTDSPEESPDGSPERSPERSPEEGPQAPAGGADAEAAGVPPPRTRPPAPAGR